MGKVCPFDERLTVVETYGAKYSSQEPASGGKAFAAVAEVQERRRGYCYYWKKGKCHKGAACRFKHEGKPAPAPAAAQTPAPEGTQNRYRQNMSELESDRNESEWIVVGRSGSRESRKVPKSPLRLENVYAVLPEVVLGSKSISGSCNDNNCETDPVGAPLPRPRSMEEEVAAQCNAWLASRVAGVSEGLGVDPGVAELLVLQELRQSIDRAHPGLVQGADSYGLSIKNSKSGYGFDDNNCIRPQDKPVGRRSARTGMPTPEGGQKGLDPFLTGSTSVLSTPEPLKEALSGGQGGPEVSKSQSQPVVSPVVSQPGKPVVRSNNMKGEVGLSESSDSKVGPSGALVANENVSELKFSYNACVFGVIADTGATVRVIGGPDCSKAVNVEYLKDGVSVDTAHGRVVVNRIGDLPGYEGLMERCLMMPDSSQTD